MINWDPLVLTFELALVTTVVLILVALPISYWLARSKSKLKPAIATLVSMPLVLPPTVLGFYFLLAFSPGNQFGEWLDDWLGLQLVFSFTGLVVASAIYSLPFMVHPIYAGLSRLPESIREASELMGKSRWTTFLKIELPNIRPSLLTGIVLSFAHTVGEFGVVLMIGGSIPGQTKVASIAIYEQVEALNYEAAHIYSAILFIITFTILLLVYLINGGLLKRVWK